MEEISDEVLLNMRIKPLYRFIKAIYIYDMTASGKKIVIRDHFNNPLKSNKNDIVETIDYICIDRCIYVDKETDCIGQIRVVNNKDSKWNPYNDKRNKVKLCNKPNVTSKISLKRQREIVKNSITQKAMIYYQNDSFEGNDDNGKFRPPKTSIYQVQIIDLKDDWIYFNYV